MTMLVFAAMAVLESNAKASDFIQGTDTRCAFVSINSIRQGEQVAPLWQRMNATVDFACRKVWGQALSRCVFPLKIARNRR